MKTFKQFQEGLLTKALIGGALAAPFVMKKIKDKFDPVGNQRKKLKIKKLQSMKREVEHLRRMVTLDNYETHY